MALINITWLEWRAGLKAIIMRGTHTASLLVTDTFVSRKHVDPGPGSPKSTPIKGGLAWNWIGQDTAIKLMMFSKILVDVISRNIFRKALQNICKYKSLHFFTTKNLGTAILLLFIQKVSNKSLKKVKNIVLPQTYE